MNRAFDVKIENKIYLMEISIKNNEKKEFIIFKAYEKESISKNIYINSFYIEQLLEMSKVFKICDNLNDIFEMIQQKFKDNEVKISLTDNLYINLEFLLPNKKIDKITFILLKTTLNEKEFIEKLYENLSNLQEKIEMKIQNIYSKKKSKTLIDILENKFKKSKFVLLRDLYKNLESFDLEKEYLKEIGNKFQSKVKTIFNAKKDGDTIAKFISKVFGKKNLAGYCSFYYKSRFKKEHVFGGQLAYFDGKFEFENNCLSFVKNDVFSYGTYRAFNSDSEFTFFRDNNAKLFIRMDKNCIYFIGSNQCDSGFKNIIQINDFFLKNPLFLENARVDSEEDFKNKKKEFYEFYQKEIEDSFIYKIYLKELKIYQIDN